MDAGSSPCYNSRGLLIGLREIRSISIKIEGVVATVIYNHIEADVNDPGRMIVLLTGPKRNTYVVGRAGWVHDYDTTLLKTKELAEELYAAVICESVERFQNALDSLDKGSKKIRMEMEPSKIYFNAFGPFETEALFCCGGISLKKAIPLMPKFVPNRMRGGEPLDLNSGSNYKQAVDRIRNDIRAKNQPVRNVTNPVRIRNGLIGGP